MHECEYCGVERCTNRACIEALLAVAAYYDAQAKLRTATADCDLARRMANIRTDAARDQEPEPTEQR